MEQDIIAKPSVESHLIFFGTEDPPPYLATHDSNAFDPGTLDYHTTYHWRIDEVDSGMVISGDPWSFTTLYAGDLDTDGDIDLDDLGILGTYWLSSIEPFYDIDHDGFISLSDVAILAQDWRK